ncbi:MAG: hypothetical protein U9R52_00130 [Candidatus Omnitrophota bacterium]|nr:hypothetical protein [Candidatus Omnitrophota bacterium]
MKFKNPFEITGIGSMPHKNEKKACDAVFANFRRIPFWPQLVNRSFLESMMAQFSERMPGMEVDAKNKKIFINRNRDIRKELEEFNEQYASDDFEYFSMSEDYAAGFYEYLYRLKSYDKVSLDYLKAQITGPVSFAFTVTDEQGVPLFFDKKMLEIAVKTLSGRARWQARKLKNLFKDIIIFIDEPSLMFFKQTASGSNIKKDELMSCINKVAGAVHAESCYAGIHCCGDADWDFVLSTDVDILSFDAYNYAGSFLKNREKISNFLQRDGIIAWGMVPTASNKPLADTNRMAAKLENYVKFLSESGIDRKKIIDSSLLTPSCGCGVLSEKESADVARACVELSRAAKERIIA